MPVCVLRGCPAPCGQRRRSFPWKNLYMATLSVKSTSTAVSVTSGRVLGGPGLGFRQLVVGKYSVAKALSVGGEGNLVRPTRRLLLEGLWCVMGIDMKEAAVGFNYSCSIWAPSIFFCKQGTFVFELSTSCFYRFVIRSAQQRLVVFISFSEFPMPLVSRNVYASHTVLMCFGGNVENTQNSHSLSHHSLVFEGKRWTILEVLLKCVAQMSGKLNIG